MKKKEGDYLFRPYEEKLPLRLVDEGLFWKHQEEEHTVVLREMGKGLEEKYVYLLKEWEKSLAETKNQFSLYRDYVIKAKDEIPTPLLQAIKKLVIFAVEQSKAFISLLHDIGQHSTVFKHNHTLLVVLHHIKRESEYFIRVISSLKKESF
ncbi:DUF2935 domain-containing protein [Massilibacterium senegalense]|uniref:DUF2935 domain-containing protein n=1 Tax=Massilibacterium senegalense TaxID=1632858 RepID=UPI00093D46A1|nr:DUF2935 domain-containing protein [Massilibacterium senegalense]